MAEPTSRQSHAARHRAEGGDHLRSVRAPQVQPGDRFLTRQGEPSSPVDSIRTTRDDFGTPALVVATLADGREVKIAYGSTIRVRTARPAATLDASTDLADAEAGSPEAVIVALARRHPQDQRVLGLASKLSRGINMRSGSQLEDIDTLAKHLFTDLDDSDGALAATELLTDLPFDGAMGRWKSIESALALASIIHHHRGDDARARALGQRLAEPDAAETDPLKAKLTAQLLQRQLNEPNLYDREISRSRETDDTATERSWRDQRLATLMYLRARGGSETLTDAELDRRIAREVAAVRELAQRIAQNQS